MKNAKSIESELDDVLGLNSKEDKPVSKTMTKDQELNSILGLSDMAVVEEKKDEVVQEDNNDFEKKKQSLINKLIDMDNNGEALKNAKNASNVEDLKAIIKSFKGEKVALADKVAGVDAFIAKLEKDIQRINKEDEKIANWKVIGNVGVTRAKAKFVPLYKDFMDKGISAIKKYITKAKKIKDVADLKSLKSEYAKDKGIQFFSIMSAYNTPSLIGQESNIIVRWLKELTGFADTDNQEQTFDELLAGLDAPVAEVEEIKSENEVQGIENLITELETELEETAEETASE